MRTAGILCDRQIRQRVSSGEIEIVPFDESCIQPASYDVHLSRKFKRYHDSSSAIIDTKLPVGDLMYDIES